TSISGGSVIPFLNACTPFPRLPITSGSRPAPKTIMTMTRTTKSSPMPMPNMRGMIGERLLPGKPVCAGGNPFLYCPASAMLRTHREAYERLLPLVEKPGRYLGNERGAVRKPLDRVAVRFALAFPEVYEIAQ